MGIRSSWLLYMILCSEVYQNLMEVLDAFLEILRRPTIWGIILGMIMLLGPVSIAFLVGIVVGWAWKPGWASLGSCKLDFFAPSSPCAALLPSTVKAFGPTHTPNTGDSSSPYDSVDNKQATLVTLAPTSRLAFLIILANFYSCCCCCFYFFQLNSD